MLNTRVHLITLIILLAAVEGIIAGCATSPSVPPPDAPQMAGPNWPPVGSTWVTNAKNTGSFGNSATQVSWTLLGKKPFEGRELMVITNAVDTYYFSEQINWIAHARGDAVLERGDPVVVNHDFPLFVGKRWSTNFTYQDLEHHRAPGRVHQDVVVETYEEVQTPAGRFKAFKITRAEPTYRITYWISPDLGIWVKWREERLGFNDRGLQENELASYNFNK